MPYREEPIDQVRVDALRAKQLAAELTAVVEVRKQLAADAREAGREVGAIVARIDALSRPRISFGLVGLLINALVFRPDRAAIGRSNEELQRAERAHGFAESLVAAAAERERAIEAEIEEKGHRGILGGEPDPRAAAAAIAAGVAAALGAARDLRGTMRELAAAAQRAQREELAYALGNTDKPPQLLADADRRQAHARSRLLLVRATVVPLAERSGSWLAGFDDAVKHVTAAGVGPGTEWCDHLVGASKAIDDVVADLERAHHAAPVTSGA